MDYSHEQHIRNRDTPENSCDFTELLVSFHYDDCLFLVDGDAFRIYSKSYFVESRAMVSKWQCKVANCLKRTLAGFDLDTQSRACCVFFCFSRDSYIEGRQQNATVVSGLICHRIGSVDLELLAAYGETKIRSGAAKFHKQYEWNHKLARSFQISISNSTASSSSFAGLVSCACSKR